MTDREEYASPDGTLRLFVLREGGDITLGFDGFAWHTHGDVLVSEYAIRGEAGLTPEAATDRFVEELLGGQAVIAVSRVNDQVRDVWVTGDPDHELKYVSAEETVELRYWDGAPWCSG